jgi:hypothetical protein
MTAEREGLIGKASPPHGHDPTPTQAETVPDEENLDPGRIEEDLEDPDEKRNATDGYAPADDDFEPTDAEDDLEKFED